MIVMRDLPVWEPGEEKANCYTHIAGSIMAFIFFITYLVQGIKSGDTYRLVGYIVSGISMLILYIISACYHGITNLKWKKVFRYGDHVSIFLLIAGSYTPFCLTILRDSNGWVLFGAVWSIAVVGIFLKIMFFDYFETMSLLFYLVMGWLVIMSLGTIISKMEPAGLYWMVFGGLSYTLGTEFYSKDSIPYAHAIWHLFVMGGTFGLFVAAIAYT